jgi:FlaA1/EpsC-like NDP-sugar epimerase
MNYLSILGRTRYLFSDDVGAKESQMSEIIKNSNFLVIGGAGTIGKAVTKEIFSRGPKLLHVVDISENNLVELVREIRSSMGYIEGEFSTFAIDCGASEFKALLKSGVNYDYIFNLSALKHVRSEKDAFTLMRMFQVNILNAIDCICNTEHMNIKKYFSVSTDKAANPVNMMGASKKAMELFLNRASQTQAIAMARFANVAFSDGSLLYGFDKRILMEQPISAPNDVMRYFITPAESAHLCLMSAFFGNNREIYFPKLSEELVPIKFSEIAKKYLILRGYEPVICTSEEEARRKSKVLIRQKKWPCHFFESDTTGEKDCEEFFTEKENVDLIRYSNIGVIKIECSYDLDALENFERLIREMRNNHRWTKKDLLDALKTIVHDFDHKETGRYLDEKM